MFLGNTFANSPLIGQIDFKQGSTLRMSTAKNYDYLNRLASIASHPGGTPSLASVSFAYQYNNANQRTRMTLADGSYWLYEYDSLGQVKSEKRYWNDHTPVAGQQNEYSFDDIGNRTTAKSGGDSNGANLRSATYTANSRNQYTSRTVPGGFDVLGIANSAASVTVNGSATDYRRGEYFQEGVNVSNGSAAVWQSASVIASNGGSSTTNSGSVFVPQTPESMTSDADGNLTQDGHWDYVPDAENRYITIKTRSGIAGPVRRLEFEYDCQGRRIRKRVYDALSGGNLLLERRFLYDGWNAIAELDGNNAVVRTYVWGLDLSGSLQGAGGVGGLVAVKTSGGVAHFAAYDGNGNVAGLVGGSSGAVSALYEYGPFGETIRVTDTLSGTNPFRFSSKYTDTETDLVYYGYRYYNPSTGRWPSRDPIEEAGGANLYTFVGNNAANRIDELGLYEIDVHYYLTAWLASKVPCINSGDSVAIARATQGVDENSATSPGYGSSERQRDVNARYHALHPGPQGGPEDAHMAELRNTAFSNCDPSAFGIYLHYLQDTFSHQGFTDPEWGHGRAGHNPDKTANDVGKASRMAVATLDAMIAWSKSCKKCCVNPDLTGRTALSSAEVTQMFQFLRAPGGGFAREINEDELRRKLEILEMEHR